MITHVGESYEISSVTSWRKVKLVDKPILLKVLVAVADAVFVGIRMTDPSAERALV